MQDLKILFRVDSGRQIGSGHVMRCLTLANAMRERGMTVVFAIREHPGHLAKRVENAGHMTVLLAPPRNQFSRDDYSSWVGVSQETDAGDTRVVLESVKADWLVVDHYGLDKTWESQLRPLVKRIMAVDDLANRHHDCDVLLDQNDLGDQGRQRYEHWVPRSCRLLLGPQYALLQPEYGRLRAALAPRTGPVRRVLIFFGGSDSTNQTAKALDALSSPELTHLAIDVVIGVNHPAPAEIERKVAARNGARLYRELSTLADLIASADLAIGAGGATGWERICLGLPTVVVTTADNQVAVTSALQANKLVWWAGHHDKVTATELKNAVTSLLHDGSVPDYAIRCLKVCDGAGASRVIESMQF